MLKSLVLCLLPLVACSSNDIKDDQFYHSLNLKPTITEASVYGGKYICAHNPFPKTLTINLDCDGEDYVRTLNVSPNSAYCFYIRPREEASMTCSIEHGWTLK